MNHKPTNDDIAKDCLTMLLTMLKGVKEIFKSDVVGDIFLSKEDLNQFEYSGSKATFAAFIKREIEELRTS